MTVRARTRWLAGPAALLIAIALSGASLAAETVTETPDVPQLAEPQPELSGPQPIAPDTLGTFEDADGNGVDDDCQATVVADPAAAASALDAADLDDDGSTSVPEAARSGWIGGTNCNHGGYMSQIANEQCSDAEATDGDCDDETAVEDDDEDAAADEACVVVPAPPFDPATIGEPGGFGAYVSEVSRSAAIGGKNCNHGGAVSDAVHAAKGAAREARDAAKAERKAEHAAAKATNRAGKGKGQGG